MAERKILWDNVIPETITIPGKSPGRREPEGHDLVMERVEGANYALYKIEYKRCRLFPEESRHQIVHSEK